MDPSNWKQIWAVFDRALDHEEGEARRHFVRSASDGNDAFESEILSLLHAHQTGSPLDRREPLISTIALANDGDPDGDPLSHSSSSSPAIVESAAASSRQRVATVSTEGRASDRTRAGRASESELKRIGPYAVLEEVGRGGMGVVYKARDERLQRLVALKMLPHHLNADSTAKTRFIAEARAAACIEHPNIATVYDIGEAQDGRLFIAMAYYEGETLLERIEQGPLALDRAVDVALQIAKGLARAHANNVIHRDIKPANVLLEHHGVVKILDFGIAKVADAGVTGSGVTVGTMAYMSPEQASGGKVDHRTDLWSLGVVLYEMIAGKRPFDSSYQDDLLYSILHEDPAAPAAVRPDVPRSVSHVVSRLLVRDPEQRYASADAFALALQSAMSSDASVDPATARGSRSAQIPAAASESDSDDPQSPIRRWMLGQSGPERVRATVVVSQLHGYSALIERLEPVLLGARKEAIRALIIDVLASLDGYLYRFDGDTIIALFGIPEAHEDDFVRAVRAARSLHTRLGKLFDETDGAPEGRLEATTGVDVGIVVVQNREGRFVVSGDVLQIAGQLSLHGDADEILMSPECERLVRPFFETLPARPIRLKGRSGTITPRLFAAETGLQTRLEASEKAGMTAYAGREFEMGALQASYDHAQEGRGQFVYVVGEAGLGKSRLLYEFCRRVEGGHRASVYRGRCQSYGSKVAYLPFVELLRQYFGISSGMSAEGMERAVVQHIASIDPGLDVFIPLYLHVLSIPSERYALPDHLEGEDLRMATVEALAGVITLSSRKDPSVVLLEDWHWADEGSQEVLKQLAELTSSYSLLLVVTYRPEHLPTWRHSGHHTQLHLKPLDEASSGSIIRSLIEAKTVADELISLLHERTGGNPFFLEESCRTLLEEGAISVQNGIAVPTGPLNTLDLPDTVQAVIRTRLHRLDHQVRKAVRVASVIGREFSGRILSEIIPEENGLGRMLVTLRDLGLIQQTRILPEPLYRFKHVLTQEVAYDSLLQHQRRALHQQVGETMERALDERLDEHLDLLVYHFKRAEDWERAARYGEQSAKRAIRMSRFPEAAAMLADVRTWLRRVRNSESRHRDRLIEVLFEHERVCETIGDRAEQQRILDELVDLFSPTDASAGLAEVYRRKGDLFVLRRRLDEAEVALDRAANLAADAVDPEVERRIQRSYGFLRWHQGRSEEAEQINKRLLVLHRESGDDKAVMGDLVNMFIIKRDLGQFDDALDYMNQAVEVLESADNPSMRAYVYHSLGTLYQLRGDNQEALSYFEKAADLAEKLRLPLQLSFSMMSMAHINLRLGRVEQSLQAYRDAIALSRRSRYADGLAKALLVFGNVLYRLERLDEALEYLNEAAEWFHRLEDAKSEAGSLKTIASIYDKRGRFDESEQIWHRLADRLGSLDITYEIDALEAFGGHARRRGDFAEAMAHYQDAIELIGRVGDAGREAHLRNSAGILAWQEQEYSIALEHYEKALALFNRLDDPEGAGLMMNSIGVTLLKMCRLDDASSQLRAAIDVHRTSGHRQLEAHALAVLGDVRAEQNDLDGALEAYAASLQLRWDLDDRRGEGWMLHHMALIHAKRSEFERAREYADQAATIATEIADDRLLRTCESLPPAAANERD